MKNYHAKIGSITVLAFTAAVCAAQQISVTINDQTVQFPNAQPQYINGRVLVPLRGVFEQMGATVLWNEANQAVTAEKGNKRIKLRIGSETARVNDQPVHLDVPAQIIDGSTMVPIRFLSESLGAQVGWNEQSHVVMLTTNSSGIATYRPQRMNVRGYDHANRMTSGIVIPVVLNTTLSARNTEIGTSVSATLSASNERYGALPRGTTIMGHVNSINRSQNGGLGTYELVFDRIKTPDGMTYPIEGTPLTLDSRFAQKGADGMWMATNERNGKWMPNEKLVRGTRFGIRLNQDLELKNR